LNEAAAPAPAFEQDQAAPAELSDSHTALRFQILSLDGGGYRGIYSAAVLAAIEEDLGNPITQYFDLIAGTSTGGIIAIGLGAGLRPRDIVEFYAKWGHRIFRKQRLRTGFGLWRRKYGSEARRQALTEVLGDRTLGDSLCRLVIPAYDLGADGVYIFKTPHNTKLKRDWKERLVDVAMATSAAPTYFPATSLGGIRLVDGGIWANNPTVIGIAEAISMCGVPLDSVRAFSLGTTSDLAHRHPRLDEGGLVQWARAAIDVLLRGQSLGADGTAQHLLTPARYLRHDPNVPKGILKMDRCDTEALIGLARTRSRELMPFFNAKFADHHAPAYQPLYARQGALT
jgi:predicted acylesterase/phospholipase RssA